ncbi:MAG: 30S ribosomal protein S20 [Candidatus Omnitrophica bacterium]|nr:30S ribosomal protein S20 [Candidatus Omnitrophota bacterium]
MPVTKSGWKRMRQSREIHKRNHAALTELKTLSKKFFALLKDNPEKAIEQAQLLYSKLDKAVTKGIIPKNRANRKKSRVAKHLRSSK